MRQLIAIFTFVCGLTLVRAKAEAESPCFAYLQNGDIYAACGEKSVRLTTAGNITDFAIAEDGSAVAIETEYVVGKTKDSAGAVADCDIRVFSPTSDSSPRSINHSCGQLHATCGTLLLESRTNGVDDLVAEKTLRIAGYQRFVCNSDRAVVAGWPGDSNRNFSVGTKNIRQVAPIAGGASVSRSGLVAYFTEASDDNSVCVLSHEEKLSCIKEADAFGRISISDSGEVLFTTHTDGGCVFRKHRIVKAHPPDSGEDQCPGIASWKPGAPKVLVKELAQHPQWLTPVAAQALATCSATFEGCFGKH